MALCNYNGPMRDMLNESGALKFETMSQIYGQSLSAIRIVDSDYTIVTQSPAMDRLVQMQAELAVGKKCFEVARARDFCHTDQCPHSQVMSSKGRVEQHYECELWNGKQFPAWVLAAPFFDKQHNLVGSVQIVRDETKIVAFKQTIEQKNSELERLLRLANGQNEIIKVLNRETRLEDLAVNTLKTLPQYTAVVTGVVYLFVEKNDRLVPLAQYALAGPAPEFSLGQGLPGQVALREEPIYVSNLPETYLRFCSGTGDASPVHIACFPILAGDRFIGALELAGFQPLEKDRQFFEDLVRQLGIAMQNALMRKQTENLAFELQAYNEKLEAQNEELKAQSEELIAQSEEIQSQAEELIAQRDALERKTIEADEANRMKSIFLSNMSHELRTPLNAILGLTRLMKDGVAGQLTDLQSEYLEVVLRNGGNLLDLINDILDLARIETGREEVRYDQIQLRGFLESLAVGIKSLAERQGLLFVLEIAPNVTTMVSDERKLGQILTNILGNAIKFTEKGEVRLTVLYQETEHRDYINFVARDTGIGISPDHFEEIFEPFRQIDGSATRKHSGSGLGLSICRKLVALLGGDITVASEQGQGTTFTVSLPCDRRNKNRLPDNEWQERFRRLFLPELKDGKVQAVAEKVIEQPAIEQSLALLEENERPGQQDSSPHILLVEDDMIAVRELGIYLRAEGYRISFSLDGKTGLDLLEKLRPDLVVLDLKMPIMDGFAFLREMSANKDKELAGIPVVVLSALDLDSKEIAKLPTNVRAVLPKGNILEEQLVEQVRAVVGQPPTRKRGVNQDGGDTPKKAGPKKVSASGRPRPGGRRVLVAEDNQDNLFLLEEILKPAGYEMLKAKNGKKAVEMVSREHPDLILMDIQMPDMSGLEAVIAIRELAGFSDIPVVAITAKAMKGDREQIMETGCDDYIAKPIDPTILLAVLDKWLGKGV